MTDPGGLRTVLSALRVGPRAAPVPARFVARPNRFVVHAALDGTGRLVVAHLADPGRLRDLLAPGRRIWLVPAIDPARKTAWSVALAEAWPDGALVSVDATLPNRLVARALRARALPELARWRLVGSEVATDHGRLDFVLRTADGSRLALEVKSATLLDEGQVARFPDAVTARGRRHVRGLAEIAGTPGWCAALLFVVQRPDARGVVAAPEIDPAFAAALAAARDAGVRLLARRCSVRLDGVALEAAIPVGP